MRIAYFTMSGSTARIPLEALLAAGWEVSLVVRPAAYALRSRIGRAARWLGLRKPDPVAELARRHGVPTVRARERHDPGVLESLRRARPDLICVSAFRWLLPPELLELPPLGGLNLHSSLLPRHRGPLPLFWTYYHDDRRAGVTVHRLSEQADAGDVYGREEAELPRGYPVDRLNEDNARRGAVLLERAVREVSRGEADWTSQDESRATRAPVVRAGKPMVGFESWDVERVWHFLAGLNPRFREPLRDTAGRRVDYSTVVGYERDPAASGTTVATGLVARSGARGALRCRDGWVHLALGTGSRARRPGRASSGSHA